MASNPPNKNHRPTFTDQEALLFHSQPRPGKLEVVATKPMATQRDLSLAYSPGVAVPVLAIAEDEALAYRIHDQRQFRRGRHQRHRHSRPRQPRRARRKAGDGRQGGAVQALRRHRLDRHPGVDRGPDRIHRLRQALGQGLGRHQSRGHQGAGVLHHRAEAARAARHPGVPRRPARHRDHRLRRAPQRAVADRPRRRLDEDRLQRRRRRRHRLARAPARHRFPAREPDPVRHQGRDLSRAAPRA